MCLYTKEYTIMNAYLSGLKNFKNNNNNSQNKNLGIFSKLAK